MIKNLDTLHKEVQLNGYLKVDNFVSNSDAEILEKKTLKAFKKAKKERLEWIQLNQDLEDLQKRYLLHLDLLNNSIPEEKIINFQDIVNRKKVLMKLDDLEKLAWIRDKIDAIEIWIDQNSFRASSIS